MNNLTADQKALQDYLQEKSDQMDAWIAEDPGNRGGGTAVPCAKFWADQGVFSIAQFERRSLETDLWESYKEVHGIRPRWMDMDSMSDEELENELAKLVAESRYQEERNAQYAAQKIDPLEGLPTSWDEAGFSNGLQF